MYLLSCKLQAGMTVFHQLNLVAIRVGDPCLTGVVHAHRNRRDIHAFAFQSLAKFIQAGHFETEMFIARADGELIHSPTSYFSRHCLVEKFKEGGIAAFKVIPERFTFLVVQREFDAHTKLIDIKVNDAGQIIGDKVKMCKLSDHNKLLFLHDLFDASHLTILQTDFDAVRVMRGFGEDIPDDAPGQFAGALILFQYDQHLHAWFYVCASLSVGWVHILY